MDGYLNRRVVIAALVAWLAVGTLCSAADVVFLAAPRHGGIFLTQGASEADGVHNHYFAGDGGAFQREGRETIKAAQLLVRSDDGKERVLVESGALDFRVCPDGQTVLASVVKNDRADIYQIDAITGATKQLTDGPGWNCQPVVLGDGDVAFLSDRDNWRNPGENYKGFTIYRMHADGAGQERIWHAGFGGVFGLRVGPDGRLYFASAENQGGRDGNGTNWGIWSINPDGGDFRPEISAGFTRLNQEAEAPWDWPCLTSDRWLVAAHYYDTTIYGELARRPPRLDASTESYFGPPLWVHNPPFNAREVRSGFQPRGLRTLSMLWGDNDFNASPQTAPNGAVSHPEPIPGNGIYFTWTGAPWSKMDLGVYAWPDVSKDIERLDQLVKVVDEPDRCEWFGAPLVPYSAIYPGQGKPESPVSPRSKRLPSASPFFELGSSDVATWNEWVLNSPNPQDVKMRSAAKGEAEYVRILAFLPNKRGLQGFPSVPNRYPGKYGGDSTEGFITPTNERTGYYTKLIPLKKFRTPQGELHLGPDPPQGSTQIIRDDGTPDTSFRVELPANQCWTFQVLDAKEQAIVTANTWHQGIPGGQHVNCQGCHAHHRPDPVDFKDTYAARDDYPRVRLDEIRTIVYERDVQPNIPGVEQRPWDKIEGRAMAFESWRQDFDDNPDWTEDQRRLYRVWQDTGFLAAGSAVSPPHGPYDDTMPPTLVIRKYKDATAVGVFDPNSGIAGLGIAADGKDVLDQFQFYPDEHVFVGPAFPDATIEAAAVDGRGNETRIERRAVEAEGVVLPADQKGYAKSWNDEPLPLAGS